MNAKPGDRIIVTEPSWVKMRGKEYVVINGSAFVPGPSEYIRVTERTDGYGEVFRLLPEHYQVLAEDGIGVAVGSRVITLNKSWHSDFYCRIFIVSEVREEKSCVMAIFEDGVSEGGGRWKLPYDSIKLLKRDSKTSSSSCPDCNGTGKILLLTSTVECGCGTK